MEMEQKELIKQLTDLYRSMKTTATQKEQLLDCLICAIDNIHPDNWVEDVADCEQDREENGDRDLALYGYNSTTDLDWLREAGIIN